MKAKVLFVDDEVELLEGVQDALHKEPYRILTANSGAEALELLDAETGMSVVVSDERMPEMTGHELLRQVRERHPWTVRIMLTGQADHEAIVSAINEGEVFRFLSKPCPADDLKRVLQQALEVGGRLARVDVGTEDEFLRQSALSLLEEEHPGISSVERAASGAIVVDERNTDIEALLALYRVDGAGA